jgi:hypothetical protein
MPQASDSGASDLAAAPAPAPTNFYEAKRALQTVADREVQYMPVRVKHAILAALGWPAPDPALDDAGKPIQVWALEVTPVLPADLSLRMRNASQARAFEARRRWDFRVSGALVARNKRDVVRRASATNSRMKVKSTELGDPLPTTDLLYPIAAANPDHLVVEDPDAPEGYVLVPLSELRGTAYVTATQD